VLMYPNQQGMVTFHCPTIMAGFAQLGALREHFAQHIRDLLMTDFDQHTYQSCGVYTEGYRDWNNPDNAGQIEPQWIMPLGIMTEIDSTQQRIHLLEPPTRSHDS